MQMRRSSGSSAAFMLREIAPEDRCARARRYGV
jgi:hypothetical protein